MKKSNMKVLVGAMFTLLGGIMYRIFEDVAIFIYIVLGVGSIALICDLYSKNKEKRYSFEQNMVFISFLVLAFFTVIFKASDDKLINLIMDFKVYMGIFSISLGTIILSVIIHVYKTQSKKELIKVLVIASLTVIGMILMLSVLF